MITDYLNRTSQTDSLPENSPDKRKRRLRVLGAFLIICAASFLAVRAYKFAKLTAAAPLTTEQSALLTENLRASYASQYQLVKELPYNLAPRNLNLLAQSAILIDVSNGCILYEKNADEIIPPASMTKLFSLFVVEEEVSRGRFSYDSIIPLPPESWACNAPPHSSLMFLGEGQRVTLEELLTGLSVCSGNDAAYALAYATCGSMPAFVDRMNQIAADLGLSHTYFEESSGYSENNLTTAREMAAFSRLYLKNHPDSLARYHSVPQFTYPKEHNLALGDSLSNQDFSQGFPRHITMPITQKNTNPLLGKLDGCDGLKTGYIDESGYNLSLTAERKGTRFLSVTMKGPGTSVSEGQAGRVHDGTELMEWAFSNFFDYQIPAEYKSIFVKSFFIKGMGLNLLPAWNDAVTIPFIKGESLDQCRGLVKITALLPRQSDLVKKISAGQLLGQLIISVGDSELCRIPLVSDRDSAFGL